ALKSGLVRACHDLSEGGLAVALAEMAFAGGLGADVTNLGAAGPQESDEVLLFAESTTRFLLEVRPEDEASLTMCFGDNMPPMRIGKTTKEPRLRMEGREGQPIVSASLADVKEAWQKPLRW